MARRWKKAAPRKSDGGVIGYAWRMVGGHSEALMAVLLSAMKLAPIDLERRIVDEIVGKGSISNVLFYDAIYLALQLLACLISMRTLKRPGFSTNWSPTGSRRSSALQRRHEKPGGDRLLMKSGSAAQGPDASW